MGALTTEEVLRQEAIAIYGETLVDKKGRELSGKDLNKALNARGGAALCLSGGGIRSASFALGLIQALAVNPRADGKGDGATRPEDSLLCKIQYLSTVSGGGYIGSWLSAWVARAGFADVWKKLTNRRDRPENEPQEISWLRAYSNYLTPKLGLGSADTWAAVALMMRNLLLNWLVILPALWAAIILFKGLVVFLAWISLYSPNSCFIADGEFDPSIIFAAIGVVLLIVALRFRTKNRPTRGASAATQRQFVACDLIVTLIASFCLTLTLAPTCLHHTLKPNAIPLLELSWQVLVLMGAAGGALVYLVSWLAAWPRYRNAADYFGDLISWTIAGAIYGILTSIGVCLAHQVYLGIPRVLQPVEYVLIILGVPWLLLAQSLAEVIFVGLSSHEDDSDSDREWFGRAGGLFLLAGSIWLIVMTLVFVGAQWTAQLWAWFGSVIGPAGGISGVIAAVVGKSSLTSASGSAKGDKPPSYKKLISDAAFSLAAVVFAAFLVILSAASIDQILFQQSIFQAAAFGNAGSETGYAPLPEQTIPLLISFAVVAFVGITASWFVNINRFSLHALYRNRLIRAFLGASHTEQRKPNPFTDFDELDNIRAWQLWPPKYDGRWPAVRGKDWQPYHVINIALNIVSTKRLAWQERKAEAFVVSPLYCGTACGKTPDAAGVMHFSGAFRPSEEYGDDKGISLGTALAISGAAASPNMGYNSSPTLAFLLTMFNVRLGWWLGNPSKDNAKIYSAEGPRFAIAPLLNEMVGNTTDESRYVYLSDGGHFENLGLYEMVRRRCRCIIVSDGGWDPNYTFDDLGNAVRKISLDLGVTIRFHGLSNLKTRDDDKTPGAIASTELPFYAIGVIDYAAADGGGGEGVILYVKAGYHKDRIFNAGVRNYAAANPAFPHESTGDQFYSESQFESYRALGFEIMDDILRRGTLLLADPAHPTIDGVLAALRDKAVKDGTP